MHPEIHALTHKFLAKLMKSHETAPEDVEWLHRKVLGLLHEKTRTEDDKPLIQPKGRGRSRVDHDRVVELLDQGYGTGQVADLVGCSAWTVSQIKKKVKGPKPSPKPTSKGLPPTATTPKDITPLVDAVRAAGPQGITSRDLIEQGLPGFAGMDARGLGKLLSKIPELHKAPQSEGAGPSLWTVRNASLFGDVAS